MRKKEKIIKKLKNKYQLQVLNEKTLKESFKIRLTPMNVILMFSSMMVLFTCLAFLLFAYTPLGTMLKGTKTDISKETLLEMENMLEELTNKKELDIKRSNEIRKILRGEKVKGINLTPADTISGTTPLSLKNNDIGNVTTNDKILKSETKITKAIQTLPASYFTPVKGEVSQSFNNREHYGTDVIPTTSDLVHAPLDGTIIFSNWTAKDGNVVCVQHENNLLTLYKHNASLRKKVGNFVQAGDVIAIVGNSGERTTSKHLHMEMWFNGLPLNPEKYINF